MRVVLLAAAGLLAAAALTTPAEAQSGGSAGFTASSSFHGSFGGDHHGRRDARRNRGFDGAAFVYDREYEGDTLWRADSFNDWWHERPNRSYPAWMSRNQDCQRVWWSGGGWTC